ncbi:MAG: hypothetical protein VXY93_11800, partial [Pseudomonadota bacterium]|nr:hypothetical protein [Pseudomonadota bacterium]
LQPTVTNSGLLNGFRLRATDNSTGLKNIFSLKPSQSSFYVTDSSGTTEAVRINTTGIGITHSLYHLGNTGVRLYFPGNNNIRFDTNSTERLRIDNTGIVSVFGDLDVDGHTNLDNVSIAGVTTTSGNVNVGGYVVSQGTSGRGGIFGQVEVGYDGTYLTVQPASGYNDLHLNYDNGSTVQIGHNSATTLTVNGNIVPKTDSARDLGLTGTRFRAAYVDTYYGDGSNLTGISGVTINNNADNRVITGSGTANTLEGEANLTFNGQKVLLINTAGSSPSDRGFQVEASSNLSDGDFLPALNFNPNASNTHRTRAAICGVSHNGTSGMHLAFLTRHAADGTQLSTSDEKVRITTDGKLGVGIDTPTEIFHIKKNDTTGPTI